MVRKYISSFQYKLDEKKSEITGFGGLPNYFDLLQITGLYKKMSSILDINSSPKGFKGAQILACIILLQVAGGDSIDDLDLLRNDPGFTKLMNKMLISHLKRKERRTIEKQHRKGKLLIPVPSPSVVHRWLNRFHDEGVMGPSIESGAFIIPPSSRIKSLYEINCAIMKLMQKQKKSTVATLDMDATLIAANKKSETHLPLYRNPGALE